MKVVTASQMAEIEKLAYREGASEEAFMEEAGKGVAHYAIEFIEWHEIEGDILLLCGKGNNAGDAYVAGCYLQEQGYRVKALQIQPIESCSKLCQQNHMRFLASGGHVYSGTESIFSSCGIIIDGIFGTGFKGIVKEPYASIITQVNMSGLPIIAVDIPSGLNGDDGTAEGPVIHATETIYLQLPKLGFFLQDAWNYVGQLRAVDFGLNDACIAQVSTTIRMPTYSFLASLLPKLVRNRHKYQRGFVVGIAGSPSMPGAALLASTAALRGGSGMMRLFSPIGMEALLAASPYEVIKNSYDHAESAYQSMLEWLNKASGVFIGPGIGRNPETKKMLQFLLPMLEKPTVIDADALNIFSETDMALPAQCMLTPHHGEMARLLKRKSLGPITLEVLQECATYAKEKKVTLVLKGAPTFILQDDQIYVCNRGDPGMAAAGSGDVLTGLLAALLAQGLETIQAAILGAFMHAMAGEYAAMDKTSYSMMASDITHHLPDVFRELSDEH